MTRKLGQALWIVAMADRQQARPASNGLPICALLAASLTGLYAIDAAALPLLGQPVAPATRLILVDDEGTATPEASGPTAAGDEAAPFAELNEALAAARARLEELSRAAEVAVNAGQARQELQAVRQENQRLTAELAAVRASRDELQGASTAAETRVAELTKAVEDAAGEVKRIEEELVALRWQNAQLNTSLARAQAAREKIELEAQQTQAALTTKVETLTASAEQSATAITRLRQELADSQERLESATSSRQAAEAQLSDLRAAAQSATDKNTRLDEQLSALRNQVTQAQDQRDRAQERVEELQSETARLHSALSSTQTEAERMARAKSELEAEVAGLRAAADSAVDVARENLLAVEDRIKELTAALAGIPPATGEAPSSVAAASPAPAPASDAAAQPAAALASEPRPAPQPALSSTAESRATVRPALAPPDNVGPDEVMANQAAADEATADEVAAAKVAVAAVTESEEAVDADLDSIKSAPAASPEVDQALMQLSAELPDEMRLQVQGLLVDLDAKVDQRGLLMSVPGASLFAVNSETIEPTAHDTLAKVAELIDAYDGRQVMIVGHTDSIGEDSYNQYLSQRRADLVKQFFVDNFGIEDTRLATEGHGEAQPIASNATLEGRRANRRVEVLILN
jgi:outer membrane protein OmpA-like peptidoglycan-associated protein/predicted  nucleic acid-binding Zn-ribbon protein